MGIRDWRLGARSNNLRRRVRSSDFSGPVRSSDFSRILRRLPSAVCGLLLLLTACTSVSMADQPRVDPLQPSDVFPHEQSARPDVEGVVSRQEDIELGPLQTGFEDGQPVAQMPLDVDDDLLGRGAEQFEIFCSPCHDSAGTGNGVVVQRGFPAPPSLHEARLRDAPDGHFFDVISNGFGHMYSYAPQTDALDRWAITAHIRQLQESRQESGEDTE